MLTQRNYIYMAFGAFGAILLTSYVPSLMKVMSTYEYPPDYANYPKSKEVKLENIPGIDVDSLLIARQKGLLN